jgi:hypothetical protein
MAAHWAGVTPPAGVQQLRPPSTSATIGSVFGGQVDSATCPPPATQFAAVIVADLDPAEQDGRPTARDAATTAAAAVSLNLRTTPAMRSSAVCGFKSKLLSCGTAGQALVGERSREGPHIS